METSIKKIKHAYFMINISYTSSPAIFGAIFYLYLQQLGFSFLHINLFGGTFWLVNFLTELPAGVFSDRYGRKASMILSGLIRALGLFLLLVSHHHIGRLLTAAALTAIGESLKSGTLESWALDRIHDLDPTFDSTQLFSKDKFYLSAANLIVTFLGAQLLAKINLQLPFILAPLLLLLNVLVVMCKMDAKTPYQTQRQAEEGERPTLLSGIQAFKANPSFFHLALSLLPLQFILSGPASQWQLFFSQKSETLITGYISILITLCAMLGHYLTPKIASRFENKLSFFLLTTSLNAGAILLTAWSRSFTLALIFFALHIVAMSSEQVYRYSVLNNEIKSSHRATLLSTFNTLESGFTVLCFVFVGRLSDQFSLSTSWTICSILLLLSALPQFLHLMKQETFQTRDDSTTKNPA